VSSIFPRFGYLTRGIYEKRPGDIGHSAPPKNLPAIQAKSDKGLAKNWAPELWRGYWAPPDERGGNRQPRTYRHRAISRFRANARSCTVAPGPRRSGKRCFVMIRQNIWRYIDGPDPSTVAGPPYEVTQRIEPFKVMSGELCTDARRTRTNSEDSLWRSCCSGAGCLYDGSANKHLDKAGPAER